MSFIDLRVLEQAAPLREGQVRVYSPESLGGRMCATSHGDGHWTIACDGPAATALARLAILAAGKRGAMVYVRKGAERPNWLPTYFESQDLVFCHHSLQLPHSAWKGMRQHLAKPQLKTLSIQTPEIIERPFRYERNGSADVFDIRSHSGTLFLAGSEPAFRYLASIFKGLSSCTETGAHNHLFELSRHEDKTGEAGDLTAIYVANRDWV